MGTTTLGSNILNLEDINNGPYRNIALDDNAVLKYGPDEEFSLFDAEWTKGAFLLGSDSYDDDTTIKSLLYRSTADLSWQDTTAGGNIVINPRPQYTRYSDPRRKGLLKNREDLLVSTVDNNIGIGRQYHEYHAEAVEPTYLRFGIIENGSLFAFLASYSNPELTSIHVHGRHSKSAANTLGQVVGVGAVLGLTIWAVGIVPSIVLAGASAAVNYLITFYGAGSSDFYTFRPLMPLYWLAVESMVNQLAVEDGFINEKRTSTSGRTREIDQDNLTKLSELYPEFFNKIGGVNVTGIISKSARRWQAFNKIKMASTTEMLQLATEEAFSALASVSKVDRSEDGEPEEGVLKSILKLFNAQPAVKESSDSADPSTGAKELSTDPISGERKALKEVDEIVNKVERTLWERLAGNEGATGSDDAWKGKKHAPEKDSLDFSKAEWQMGTGFAVMRFDDITGMSDRWSNSTTPTKVAGMLNSATSSLRTTSYELGGVRQDADVIMDAIKGLIGIGSGFGTGVVEGANAALFQIPGAIQMLLSGVQADIPDHWSDSSASVADASFSTTLVVPNQHPVTRILGLYIPLAMLITAVAPRQVGPYAYTGPYMVSAFTRGKVNISKGIVTSLSLEREATNQTSDFRNRPMSFKVTMNIKDLTPMAHMLQPSPVPETSTKDIIKMTTGDSVFNRWIRTLAGRGIEDDYFAWQRAAIAKEMAYSVVGGLMSPSRRAMANQSWMANNSFLDFYVAIKQSTRARVVLPASLTRP